LSIVSIFSKPFKCNNLELQRDLPPVLGFKLQTGILCNQPIFPRFILNITPMKASCPRRKFLHGPAKIRLRIGPFVTVEVPSSQCNLNDGVDWSHMGDEWFEDKNPTQVLPTHYVDEELSKRKTSPWRVRTSFEAIHRSDTLF
jgi:hypothetical protein